MAAKKRSSSKRKTQRKGLSGNPQRRADQLLQREIRDSDVLMDLAYRLAGGVEPVPWWPQSHERILAAARTAAWPSRLVDVETRACELVGDEFYDRLNSSDGGLHPSQWLAALAGEAGAELQTMIQNGGGDWEQLWALLCGLALTAPQPSPSPSEEAAPLRVAREMFPDIHDAYEVARAEVVKAAKLLADRGAAAVAVSAAVDARPAGEPVFARDVYGSRVLLAVPFGYGGDEPDHWYAWDIDLCWINVVVGAGVFGSAQDALAQWRDAAGLPASGAVLAPCPAEMIPVLLDSCLETGPLADGLEGEEPRELIREYYRLRRRARALAWSAGASEGVRFDYSDASAAFQDWYAARHDDVPGDIGESVAAILYHWGPRDHPDERACYACSPHRIEMTAIMLRDGYAPEDANEALLLLPEWTRWCLSRSGLAGDFAARSLDAARDEAADLVDDWSDDRDDEVPFRRQE